MKTVKKSFMITCLDATLFVSRKEEKKLSFTELLKLYLHLAICEFCRLFEKQNKFMVAQLKHIHSEVLLSGDEKTQLQLKIEQFTASK